MSPFKIVTCYIGVILSALLVIGFMGGSSEAGRGSREAGVKDSVYATHTSEFRGHFVNSTTATHTRFLLYDVDNGQMERVSVSGADSCEAGYKCLRIAN